jgi:hypothetical protein
MAIAMRALFLGADCCGVSAQLRASRAANDGALDRRQGFHGGEWPSTARSFAPGFWFVVIAIVAQLLFSTGVPARAQSAAETVKKGHLGPSSAAPAGDPAGGFVLSIGMNSSSVGAGSTWSIDVELRNVSGEPQSMPLRAVPCMSDFTLRNDATGVKQTFSPANCDVYQAPVQTIPPGSSYFFVVTFGPQDVRLLPGTFSLWAVAPAMHSWTGEPVISVISNNLLLRVLPEQAPMSSPGSLNAAVLHT